MASCRTEKHSRLILMMSGWCTTMRAVVEKHVPESCPKSRDPNSWTLDHVLENNSKFIHDASKKGNQRILNPHQIRLLFPGRGETTKLEQWDIQMLSVILVHICGPHLKEYRQIFEKDIEKMREIRNKLCDFGNLVIEDKVYDAYSKQMKEIISIYIPYINIERFSKEMNTFLKHVESGVMGLDEMTESLKDWYDSDKHIEYVLVEVTDGIKEVSDNIDKVDDKMDELSEDQTTLMRDIRFLLANSCPSVTVPATDVEIYVKNCNVEISRTISERFVEIIRSKLVEPLDKDDVIQAINEAMRDFLSSDMKIIDAKSKCVQLDESNAELSTDAAVKSTEIEPTVNLSWKTCLEQNSKNDAKHLLAKGHLPDGQEFKLACTLWRHSDLDVLKDICIGICKYIKTQSDSIKSVYAAYKAEKTDEVVFVVDTETGTISDITEYKIVLHRIDVYSEEGSYVMKFGETRKQFFTYDESLQLRTCLQNHSDRLMKTHSNLNIISACSFKSEKFEVRREDPIHRHCIVLYVNFKGYIPICEEPFPTHLDGIPVDVREGSFQFCGPTNFHEQLKMGCQIGSYKSGTLGAFLNVQNNICCLTSAHVLLNEEYMHALSFSGEQKWSVMDGPKVYQPNTNADPEFFGNVIQAVYRRGDGKRAGIEVALVAMHRRKPEDGSFPVEDTSGVGNIDMRFSSGQICFPSPSLEGLEVIMFGSESGFTRGIFRFHGAGNRPDHTVGDSNWGFPLLNQIVIQAANIDGRDFGKMGDSGALVLVPFHGDYSDLRTLGLFEGKTTDGLYIVTPICDILEVLGNPTLMVFRSAVLEELSNSRLERVEQRLADQLGQHELRLAQREQSQDQRLSRIEETLMAILANTSPVNNASHA